MIGSNPQRAQMPFIEIVDSVKLKVFKKGMCYIITRNITNIWEKIFKVSKKFGEKSQSQRVEFDPTLNIYEIIEEKGEIIVGNLYFWKQEIKRRTFI